jgi:phage terminase large subunit-like protein
MADPGCPDCGWAPSPGALWPSEGALAVRWIEKYLVLGEGDWYGQPVRLRKDQKLFLMRWYEYCGRCWYWRYDEALRGAATGDGKTTFVAAIQCLEMFGPPQIAPLSPNIVNAAASFEQADLLFGTAGLMVGGRDQIMADAPLCGYAEVYDTEIRFSDGRPGVMRRVAAVAGTNEGGLPSLFVGDELHEWGELGSGKARVHMVIGKSTTKRRLQCRIPLQGGGFKTVSRGAGRKLGISTAGFDVDMSLLGAMYLHGKRAAHDPSLAPRLLLDWHEAPEGLDYANPEHRRIAVRAASEAAGVLWDVEARVREWDKPGVQSHEWIRYYANRWVDVAEESWLADHPAAWGECEGKWGLNGDEQVVIAIDMSLKRDSTAVVECTELEDGRIAVTARIWNPGDGKVDHKEVFQYIKDRARELGGRLAAVTYDPRYFELAARELEDEDDLTVIEFDQWVTMVKATGEAFDRIIRKRIVHAGDKELSRHVRSAVKKQQERGFTLSKNKSRWKIDGAVAMCMGIWTLSQVTSIEDTFW